jgi:hypothetical protein
VLRQARGVEMSENKKNSQSQTTTLTSLAILTVDIDSGNRDYLDYLSSFVIEGLALRRPAVVNETQVVSILSEEFGLRIPLKAVQHVLRRLARKSSPLLMFHDGIYSISPSFPAASMTERRAAAEARIESVYVKLRAHTTQLGVDPPWDEHQASRAVLSFLGQFAIDCLKTHVFSTALPSIPESSAKEHYIVGRFLHDAYQHSRETFEDFIVLVKGQMYANALTCPDLQSLEQRFSTLTCYLDTPLVLNLLDAHGAAFAAATSELVELVRGLSGSLAVFHHTIEEVRNVLRYCIKNFDNPVSSNRALRELRAIGQSKSQLVLLEAGLEARLKDLHIKIVDTPPYKDSFQIDETAFRAAISEEVLYLGEPALDKDVNSIRSIYVKRQGRMPSRLEDAGAVFVTSNSAFAKAAYEQGKQHNSSREVSPAITDYSLANVAWLKSPLTRPQLPERETLALCYAGLEPSKILVEKYVATMDRMRNAGRISEDDHAILRASAIAEDELMHLTLGDDDALTEQSISQILDRTKETLARELTITHQKELEERDAKIAAAEAKAQFEATRADAAEAHRAATISKARGSAKIISRVILAVPAAAMTVALFVGGASGTGLIDMSTITKHGPLGFVVSAAAVFCAVFGLYGSITGHTLFSTVERLTGWIEAALLRVILPK